MWWLFAVPKNTQIEVNPKELIKFLIQESQFLHQFEGLIERMFQVENLISGKSFFLANEIMMKYSEHLKENMIYFMPKEINE